MPATFVKIIGLIILMFPIILSAQNGDLNASDSLAEIKLDYRFVEPIGEIINQNFPNVRKFTLERDIDIAYIANDNKWFAFHIADAHNVQLIDLDKNGKPEIIVKGTDYSYGSGGGTALKWI